MCHIWDQLTGVVICSEVLFNSVTLVIVKNIPRQKIAGNVNWETFPNTNLFSRQIAWERETGGNAYIIMDVNKVPQCKIEKEIQCGLLIWRKINYASGCNAKEVLVEQFSLLII